MTPLVLAAKCRSLVLGNSRNWLMLKKGASSAAAVGKSPPAAINKNKEVLQSAFKPNFS